MARQTTWARLALSFGIAFALAGCLFPSFDDLQASSVVDGNKPETNKRRDGGARKGDAEEETDVDEETPVPITRDASVTFTPFDGGGVRGPSTLKCGNTTCNVGTEFCCYGIGGPEGCRPANDPGSCSGPLAGRSMCDDKSDCPGAQVCCETQEDTIVQCADSCVAKGQMIVCTGDPSSCPVGTRCNVDMGDGTMGCGPG